MDYKFAVFPNISCRVFSDRWLAITSWHFVAGSEGHERRVRAKDIKEGKRGRIDPTEAIDGGDPGDGAGSN